MKGNAFLKPLNVRLDIWLWAARFFKTRALASQAISLGHVIIFGGRCKASKPVCVGTVIQIKQNQYCREILVTDVNLKRASAQIAAKLYKETAESLTFNQELKASLKNTSWAPRPSRKPDSRERRLLTNVKRFSGRVK